MQRNIKYTEFLKIFKGSFKKASSEFSSNDCAHLMWKGSEKDALP